MARRDEVVLTRIGIFGQCQRACGEWAVARPIRGTTQHKWLTAPGVRSQASIIPEARSGLRPRSRGQLVTRAQVFAGVMCFGALAILTGLAMPIASGPTEAMAIETSLRETGYLVSATELLAVSEYPGSDGHLVPVPDGARVYAVSYQAPGSSAMKTAYRLVGGPLDNRWTFPSGR